MSQETFGGMFLYRGNAQGIGSSFFPVQAPCSLPTIGGLSESLVEGFRHERHDVCIDQVSTRAYGYFNEEEKAFETEVVAKVHGARIGKLFKVKHAFVSVTSRHTLGKTKRLPVQVRFPEHIEFEFAGYPGTVTFHPEILELDTKAGLLKAMGGVGFRKRHHERFYRRDSKDPRQLMCAGEQEAVSEVAGYIIYSPVAQIKWEGTRERGNTIDGHVLTARDYGRCFIGETFRDDHSCRTNLFRFTIGAIEEKHLNLQNAFKAALTKSFGSVNKAEEESHADDDMILPAVGTNGVYIPP